MSALLLASALAKTPVVTLGGDAVAQVRDIVFDGPDGQVAGFTLNGRGLLAGPLKQHLPWAGVHGMGRDAVMIADESALVDGREPAAAAGAPDAGGGDVLGDRVVTREGVDLGQVVDVVLSVGLTASVVGYQVASGDALGHHGRRVLVPRDETTVVSGEALIVPADIGRFAAEELESFATLAQAFRDRPLKEA